MRATILLLFAAALGAQQPVPRPHGPYADREGWVCYRGETVESAKRVQCACKMPCENDGVEDRACLTYCASQKCVCHLDENCGHAHR